MHYRQGTFHCYILSCVVSGDKRTTILISIRRKNTWLEPMKSAFSFCHWLRPSGLNKVWINSCWKLHGNTPLYIRLFSPTPCLLYGFILVSDLIGAHRIKQSMTSLKHLFPCFPLFLSLCVFVPRTLPFPLSWLEGWPCQSICERLTVLQHMRYTDGQHHSRNKPTSTRARTLKSNEREGLNGLKKRK